MDDQPALARPGLRLLPDPEPGDGAALPLLLARLGDEASRMVRPGGDVRPQVLACQAQHLAAQIAALPGWPPPGRGTSGVEGCLRDLALTVGRLTRGRLPRPLPPRLGHDIERLLDLAAAVTP